MIKSDAIMLLKQASPSQTDVLMRQMGFTIDFSTLLNCFLYDILHEIRKTG